MSGTAGKFNIIPLMLTIGAGLGLMSISVLVADCVMLHCTKDRKFFQKMKELDVKKGLLVDDFEASNLVELNTFALIANQSEMSNIARL